MLYGTVEQTFLLGALAELGERMNQHYAPSLIWFKADEQLSAADELLQLTTINVLHIDEKNGGYLLCKRRNLNS